MHLGPELIRLAREVDLGTVARELAAPRLGELSDALRETVTLSVTAPDGSLDLAHQVDGPQHLVPRSWLGQRFALHASSSGKVLLATFDEERLERFLGEPLEALTPATITTPRALRQELDRVREERYAATVDEMEEGLAGVSVGIFNEAGTLLGFINVSGLSQRLDEAGRHRAVEQTRLVVDELEAALQRGSRTAG